MSAALNFLLLFLHLFFLPIAAADSCPASVYSCGTYTLNIDYPFYTDISDSDCQGIYLIQCTNLTPLIKLPGQDFLYPIYNISYHDRTLIIHDIKLSLSPYQWGSDCAFLYNFRPPIGKSNFTELSLLISSGQGSLFNCNQADSDFNQSIFSKFYNSSVCRNYDLYYTRYSQPRKGLPAYCSTSGTLYFSWKLLFSGGGTDGWGFSLVSAGFSYNWELQPECFDCQIIGGHSCVRNCRESAGSNSRVKMKSILIGVTIAIGGCILVSVACLLCYRQKKRVRYSPSRPLVRTISPNNHSKEPYLSYSNYPTHIFSYSELDYATNSFDDSQQIGDGGFGIVYKGKLKDGRIIAVKRLYENSYKRLQQFINEIEILSRLRHPNLVSLYGCTSHHSQELLLVCEYVPNGTVADHLHGVRVDEHALCWPLRLKIAIETAEALSYLHAAEPIVIHRDVKTSNILLDNSFHVKVADFGLSRLVPTDATHVSTAPQGTPGYLDPEYHQCYQLTDKSDVYSFGVVLVELISSKQAVDINRHRNEINLASMAISKIQNRTLEQLVDLRLGYQSDCKRKRMITQVAELAFRCLQTDSEFRPSIREVVEVLKAIENDRYKTDEAADQSDVRITVDACLSMKADPFSPNSVIEKWDSRTTTMSNKFSDAT